MTTSGIAGFARDRAHRARSATARGFDRPARRAVVRRKPCAAPRRATRSARSRAPRRDAREVRERVRDVPGRARLVHAASGRAADGLADQPRQLVDRRSRSARHVVRAPARARHRAAAARRFAATASATNVKSRLCSPSPKMTAPRPQIGAEEPRDDGRVRAVGILPRPVDVEVAQADELDPVAAAEDLRELLVHRSSRGRTARAGCPPALRASAASALSP